MKQITMDELSNSIAFLNFQTSLVITFPPASAIMTYCLRTPISDVALTYQIICGHFHTSAGDVLMALHVVKYKDVLRCYIGLSLRHTQDVADLLWGCREKGMAKSTGRLLGTFLVRNFADWVVYIQT